MSVQKNMWLVSLSFLLLVACSGQYGTQTSSSNLADPEGGTNTPNPNPEPPVPGPDKGDDPAQSICSVLDFKGVSWPSDLTASEHTYYALALNITGSFEGHVGWKNIAGNFDGQGISLGLLQQNLGQGTLQPLLVDMFRTDYGTLKTHFSSTNLRSLQGMLETWLNSSLPNGPSLQSLLKLQDSYSYEELFPNEIAFNSLDEGYEETVQMLAAGDTSKSIAWARANALDSKGNVLTPWKASFQSMAESARYRSLQLQASTKIFIKALAYFEALKFVELRSLLLMFDLVVQNGSIGSNHLNIYNQWLVKNSTASEEAKALALLEARLTTVKDQYKADVRSRKTAIIKGTGVVHQTQRNLPKEYCFDPRVKVQ